METSQDYHSREMLARVATDQLRRMYDTYRAGFLGWQPDEAAIDAFNQASLELLNVVANTALQKVDKDTHYAFRQAVSDASFQAFMGRLTK